MVACGLITGEKYDEAPDAESKEREQAWQSVKSLFTGFIEKFGDTDCRTLTNVDFSIPEEQKRYRDEEIYKTCFEYVRYVIEYCFSF